MPDIRYRLVNVFAETPFGGNPLAVIEDASALSDGDMQRIARQFNLSETAFVLPSTRAAARIRIFTPAYEMPFAGHPTLGAAHVVRDLYNAEERFSLELDAGIIPVHLHDGRWHLAANRPRYRALATGSTELATMLNVPPDALGSSAMWIDCGTEQAMIPLSSVAAVHACRPDPALMAQYCSNRQGQGKVYVFAHTAEGFEARYFSTTASGCISEDPGTGSACANLGGWWERTAGSQPLHATVRQATAINRPSVLTLRVADGGITVGGRVLDAGSGTLRW